MCPVVLAVPVPEDGQVALLEDLPLFTAHCEANLVVRDISPTDMIKIRMQSGVKYDGVIDAFTSIAAASGVLSLWDGWAPNVQRSFIVNAAELATYDYFKQLLCRLKICSEGLLLHTLASSLAGLVAAIFSTPVDRAKTLLMTDRNAYGSVGRHRLLVWAGRHHRKCGTAGFRARRQRGETSGRV